MSGPGPTREEVMPRSPTTVGHLFEMFDLLAVDEICRLMEESKAVQ